MLIIILNSIHNSYNISIKICWYYVLRMLNLRLKFTQHLELKNKKVFYYDN